MNGFENLYSEICIVLGIILAIIIVIFLIQCFQNIKNKKQFATKYYLEEIPKGIRIKKNTEYNQKNTYELRYPRWLYPNKDGTKNKVRKNNSLIFYPSILYFNEYKAITKSPCLMIEFVEHLRNQHGENIIKKNKEETEKYKKIKVKKEFINRCDEIQLVIERFSDIPSNFEVFCAELYEKMEYKVEVTPKVNDGGYDIILYKNNEKTIVECKCYAQNHSIGRPMIQKLVGANQEAKADYMSFITTSKFSKEAIAFAKETNVELIDGIKLVELINKYFTKEKTIRISRDEWKLDYEDLQKYYPPDVKVQ